MTRFDERDREAAVARYTKRYRKFGYSPKSLGWFSGRQEIRFDVLTSQYDFRGRHVLDVGCGFGDLVVPLLRRWPTARYTGVDFNPHFVEEACRRHGGPVTHFHLGEFLDWSPPETPDYVVGSGLFNHRYEHADNHQVIEAFVVKALTTARDGLAFDFSSAGRPGERPDAFSVEPGRILQMVRRHTRRVTLRHDYMPWEFAVFAWRDDDGDADENISTTTRYCMAEAQGFLSDGHAGADLARTVPLFDAATHPTIDGTWGPRSTHDAGLASLRAEMAAAGVVRAFAIGMAGRGGYAFERYAGALAASAPELLPVAWVPFDELPHPAEVDLFVRRAREAGYIGVKIHPRFAGVSLSDPRVADVVEAAQAEGLVAMLCTHLFDSKHYGANTFEHLALLLERTRAGRLVLLHGGTVRLLELVELAKVFPNTLVDVSFTLCKYAGSSLDLDLGWVFRTFHERVCVGSDHPEFRPAQMRERFAALTLGLGREAVEDIAFRNLATFTGLTAGFPLP